ncbi:MAG: hypothetical protein JRN10_02445 [Nitrososphaerota archaeon]|nr:hypothetical protein [Nitrososphaerota archaeon]MDG6930094.1 hypothetical protein [Nitrososphaerota archaeon]
MVDSLPKNFTVRGSLKVGIPMLVIPVLLLVVVLLLHSFLMLDYLHVGSGLAWTGMDLILGIFFSNVMRGLRNEQRARVAMRLTPVMLFFMPSISSVTVTAGVYLAIADGYFNPVNDIIIIALAIVSILFVIGLGIFLPNEVRIYTQLLRGPGGDMAKVIRLTMMNLRLSLIMVVLQIMVILMMAQLATGVFL